MQNTELLAALERMRQAADRLGDAAGAMQRELLEIELRLKAQLEVSGNGILDRTPDS